MNVMMQFLVRWNCGSSADEELHVRQMLMLFWDCRHLSASMMTKAGDKIATTPGRYKMIPTASEIMGAVSDIMADRAAKQAATHREATGIETPIVTRDGEVISATDYRPGADTGDNAERCRAMNLRLIASDAPYRVVPLGLESAYRVPVVDDGTIVPNHVCDGKGGVYHMLGGKRPAMAMAGEDA
jgi:hypothetical protein